MKEESKEKSSGLTLQDRLDHGNLTVEETCELKNRGKTGFYADVKAGLVSIRKIGRKTVVPGPIARRYIAGEPLNCAAAEEAAPAPGTNGARGDKFSARP